MICYALLCSGLRTLDLRGCMALTVLPAALGSTALRIAYHIIA
jgi:hypothetical protein